MVASTGEKLKGLPSSIVLLLTGGWKEAGSISGSNLLAVSVGYSTADVREEVCTLRILLRLTERQTAGLRNFQWKVRGILCIKSPIEIIAASINVTELCSFN